MTFSCVNSSPAEPVGITLLSDSVTDCDLTSVEVTFQLSDFGPARLCWYECGNPQAIAYTNGEDSFTYSAHRQTIRGLEPDTCYTYVVQTRSGENADGDWVDISQPQDTQTKPDPNSDPRFVGYEILDCTETSFRLGFTLSQPAPARTCFYACVEPELEGYTTGEESFDFATHAQNLTDLEPDTCYILTVQTRDGANFDGEWVDVSPPIEVYTKAETVISPGDSERFANYPVTAKNDHTKQMSGLFYGTYEVGFIGGNSNIANENSRRFRARCTRSIVAVAWQSRRINTNDIANRSEVFYQLARQYNLTPCQTSLFQGNLYSVGSGGHLVIEIRRDLNGFPDESPAGLLGHGDYNDPFIPLNGPNNSTQITQNLVAPTPLQEGQYYHIMWKNLSPYNGPRFPTTDAGAQQAAAAVCNENSGGKISFNGTQGGNQVASVSHPESVQSPFSWDPFRGNGEYTLYRQNTTPGSAWLRNPRAPTWYEVQWDNGLWDGDSQGANRAGQTNNGGARVLSNTQLTRSEIIPECTRRVTGVWTSMMYHGATVSNQGADSSPLNFDLFENGNLIYSGQWAANPAVRGLSTDTNDRNNRFAYSWEYIRFPATIELKAGSTYHAQLSANTKAGYMVATLHDRDYAAALDRSVWGDEEQAQYSTNSGQTWSEDFSGNNFLDIRRTMPLLFTIEGCPEALT